MKSVTTLLQLILVLLAAPLQAEIYQWQGEDGSTVYSDQKASDKAVESSPNASTTNVYSAPRATATQTLPKLEVVEDAYFVQPVTTKNDQQPQMTEQECQEIYGLNCDRVINWKKYALEACGNDERCDDEGFLDRKYRPRTKAEKNSIAKRAGIRKNNARDEIRHFLWRKYTNFCANQTVAYCAANYATSSEARQCRKQLEANCKEPRGIEDVLDQYDQLSPAEQRAILQQAKNMALSDHDNDLNYAQLLDRLVDLMLAASALGL